MLIVSSSFFPKIDGSTRCVYDHARKLAERGNSVCLVTRGMEGTPRYEVFKGISIFRSSVTFRSGTLMKRAGLILEQALTILRLQRSRRFDVIHVHGYTASLAALPCKYLFRTPLLITTHGTELLWPKRLWWKRPVEVKLGLLFEKFVLSQADAIVAQSEGVRDYMLRIYGKRIARKIRIVPTGVDHVKFSTQDGMPERPSVLFVGALSEIKGVSCLLRAYGSLRSEFPDSELVLVGSGPQAPKYKELVKSLGLGGSVRFQGPVRDDEKLLELYKASTIVVLPSNVGGPISCTLLEGMSCGRAVISTDVPGGIPDVLGEGAGLLIQTEDHEALAADLKKLAADREYLLQLGRTARNKVEARYTLEIMTDELSDLYEEVASRR